MISELSGHLFFTRVVLNLWKQIKERKTMNKIIKMRNKSDLKTSPIIPFITDLLGILLNIAGSSAIVLLRPLSLGIGIGIGLLTVGLLSVLLPDF